MALSGTIPVSTGSSKHTAWIEWSAKQNIENNYSMVTATLYCQSTAHGEISSFPSSVVMVMNGTSSSYTGNIPYQGQTYTLNKSTVMMYHAADGTLTFTFRVGGGTTSMTVAGNTIYPNPQVLLRCNVSVTLDKIPRQAQILTAPNFTDEDNPTITYNNPLGEGATSIAAAISLDGSNPDIEYRDIDKNGTEYTFELTDEERNVLRAATRGSNTRTVLFYVRTVIGDNYYFSYKEVSYSIINGEPIVEASVIDINTATVALTGNNTTLIRGYSTAYAEMVATPVKEAEIKTYNIEHNGGRTSGATLTVPNVNGNTFAFIVSDSRGNTTNELVLSPMIDYIRPTANINTEEKMDTNGQYLVKCAGNFFNDTFGYTSAATMNTITVQYRYKTQGGSYGSWYAMTATVSENTYTAQAQATGLDYRQTYVIQCRIVDKLNTILSAEITVRSIPIFHWSGEDFVFEVPVKFNAGTTGATGGTDEGGSSGIDTITGDLNIIGNLRMKGTGNYGNTIYFGDSSYAYITETTDDDLTIKASDINLNGNVYVNGNAIGSSNTAYGTWTPTLAASNYVSSYSVREGWYQKVGNVVTIGWMIKATTASSGIGTTIKINGCPYTPSTAAFGGGIAHNVYMQGNFTFTGWTIGDDGVISARGQSCNNAGAANHEITSTVCYGTSGNLMTLSGTICFMV